MNNRKFVVHLQILADVFRMKRTFLQCALAGSVCLLAIFWMRTVLLCALLIATILICSWLIGLMMSLQFSQVPDVAVGDSTVVCDNQRFYLHSAVVRLLFFITVKILYF